MRKKRKNTNNIWMKWLILSSILILPITGCGKKQTQYLDFPAEMMGEWQCESGTLEDPSDYVGYFVLYINEDGTFSMYDAEAGNPGISGKMNILSEDQLQFSEIDKVDFDPPHSWQSMSYDQVITYQLDGMEELRLCYTDEKTGKTSTLVFHQELIELE